MTIGEVLGGGLRLAREHPRALAMWAVLYFAVALAMAGLTWPMMGAMVDFQRQVAAAQATGAPIPTLLEGMFGAVLLTNLLTLVVIVAIFAAVVRAAAWGGHDRFGFLRIGMDEARLVGLALLLSLILFGGAMVLMAAAIVIAGVLYAALGAGAMIVLFPLFFVIFAVIVWAEVRISLAGALTVLRGRIVLREAWATTRGRFWTLFGAYLLISLAYMVASILLAALLFPDMLSFQAGMLTGAADPASMPALFAQFTGWRMAASAVIGAVVNTALMTWLFGAVATAALTLDGAAERTTAA